MTVDEYLDRLAPDARAAIEALRAIVVGSHDGLTEHIKWNAPSFVLDGQDRITLGVSPKGGFRMVLHRGARPSEAAAFPFEDPAGLARWPSPDRGVIQLADTSEIEMKAEPLGDICSRWLALPA